MPKEGRYYKYFLLGESGPVRVIYDERGLKYGAETPDRNGGRLVNRTQLLSRLEQSPEVRDARVFNPTPFTQFRFRVPAVDTCAKRFRGP